MGHVGADSVAQGRPLCLGGATSAFLSTHTAGSQPSWNTFQSMKLSSTLIRIDKTKVPQGVKLSVTLSINLRRNIHYLRDHTGIRTAILQCLESLFEAADLCNDKCTAYRRVVLQRHAAIISNNVVVLDPQMCYFHCRGYYSCCRMPFAHCLSSRT